MCFNFSSLLLSLTRVVCGQISTDGWAGCVDDLMTSEDLSLDKNADPAWEWRCVPCPKISPFDHFHSRHTIRVKFICQCQALLLKQKIPLVPTWSSCFNLHDWKYINENPLVLIENINLVRSNMNECTLKTLPLPVQLKPVYGAQRWHLWAVLLVSLFPFSFFINDCLEILDKPKFKDQTVNSSKRSTFSTVS